MTAATAELLLGLGLTALLTALNVSMLTAGTGGDPSILLLAPGMVAYATLGWFINDLHRHPLPYWAFTALSTAVRWHPFVRHDGPVSIARAFKPDDWARIVPAGARIERWFPFRLCVARTKADARA